MSGQRLTLRAFRLADGQVLLVPDGVEVFTAAPGSIFDATAVRPSKPEKPRRATRVKLRTKNAEADELKLRKKLVEKVGISAAAAELAVPYPTLWRQAQKYSWRVPPSPRRVTGKPKVIKRSDEPEVPTGRAWRCQHCEQLTRQDPCSHCGKER